MAVSYDVGVAGRFGGWRRESIGEESRFWKNLLSVEVLKRQDLTELLLRELLTDNRAMSNYMAAARKPFCEFLRWCLAQLDEAATESGYPDKAFYRLASKPRVRNGILATLTLLTGSPSPAVCRALKKVRHEFN